jgi:cyclopropane fatty-acyl-phospholipid synthase-like methyltransferase
MPTSHLFQLNEIMELITLADPKRVLDIGVGFGKFGFLMREYLELWDRGQKYGQRSRVIEGVEIFEDYLTPVHRMIYDKIHIGSALDVLPTLQDRYDLILMVDVFEHFSYEDGIRLLEMCRRRGESLILSIPRDIGHQGPSYGNPHEAHQFQWTRKHFRRFPDVFFSPNDFSLICYIGPRAGYIRKQVRKRRSRIRRWTLDLLALVGLKGPLKKLLAGK